MKRHNMWGNSSPRKYFRLASDSGNSEDASHNTALKFTFNTENTTIRKPVAHPLTYSLPGGHGNYSNQARFSNSPPVLLPTPVTKTPKPGLLPTPSTVEASQYDRSTSELSTVNIIATTVHQSKNNPPSLHYQKLSNNCEHDDFSNIDNYKNDSSCNREASPNISRYITNLDEFLSSDTEIPVKTSDTEELEVHSEPILPSQTVVNELDSSNCNSERESDAKFNARYTGSTIDRKRYQSGAGYYEILKLASENVKRQRRLSNQSNETGKHDGNQQRTHHRSGSTLKKKSLAFESPTKPLLDTCIETHRRTEQLIISEEVQRKLDQTGILKISLRKLSSFSETTVKTEIKFDVGNTSDIGNKENSERESLFERISIDREKEPSVEEKEISVVDTTKSNQNLLSLNSTPSPQKSTENTPSKERENVGLFERIRSSSVDVSPNNNEQDKTTGDSSNRDNSPKKICKTPINLKLLKERFAKTAFMKQKKLEGSPPTKLDVQSDKEVITEQSVEVTPFSREVEGVPISSLVSSDLLGQEKLASEEHVMEPDELHSEPEEEMKENDVINDGDDSDNGEVLNLSSDDDDDLPEPSIFLGNSTRSDQPKCTEEKEIFSQDSPNDSLFENSVTDVQEDPPEPQRLKLTLDKMVRHKQDNQLKDAELSEISKELKEDMVTDWMVRATLESSNDILPDHKKQLEKFSYQADHLPDIYPGENVFNVDLLGEIFSFPSTLSLADCGFIPVKGKATDSLLWRASPDDLVGLVNSCLLVEAHQVRPCQNALMVWMFYLMSIHSNIHTIMQAFQTMWALMKNSIKFNQGWIWLPTFKQITRVLLNYGATFESLFPCPTLQPTFSMNDVINENGKGKENMVREGTCTSPKNQSSMPKKQFPIIGLNHVIKVITHGMHLRDMHKQPVFYSEEELKQLIGVICRAGLETQGREDTHGEDFRLCISSLLDAFSHSTWPSKCKDLSPSLPALCSHHHNLVHLVDLFPSFTDRGRTIRRLLSYYALHKLLSEDNPTGNVKIEKEMMSIEELKVCDLFPLLRSLRPNSDTDYYRLHSIITLVDTCIGNEPLPTDEQESLYKLVKELHNVSSEIRASPLYPSRSKVKHVLQRISIKYNIMADNMITKKFNFSKYVGSNITNTPVEHVIESRDECEASDTESADDNTESADDDIIEVKQIHQITISSDDSESVSEEEEEMYVCDV